MTVAHRPVAGLLALAGVLGGGLACTGPPPSEPSPFIVATPTTVCQDDDYRTPITLSGSQSAPILTLVPVPVDASTPPLQYLWTLTGSAYRLVDGGGTLTSEKLTVTIAGDQPLEVDLDVRTSTGASADTTATVSVTSLDAGVCPLGNPG